MIGSTYARKPWELQENDLGVRDFRSRRPQRAAAERFLRGPFQADRGLRAGQHLRLSLRRAACDSAARGSDCYHCADHHATPLGMAPSPSVYLAAIAQRTRTLRFGPMVYTL